MIDQIINFCFVVLLFLSISQPSIQRAATAVLFIVGAIIHSILFGQSSALTYYSSASIFNLGVIALTSGINPAPRAVKHIQLISLIMCLTNGLGYLIWYLYYPTVIYSSAFVILYLWAIFALIRRDKEEIGGYDFGSWRACIRFNKHRIFNYLRKSEKA